MAVGSTIWFDAALDKIADGTIDLVSDTFRVVLLTDVQALTAAFVGASTDCLYADLTDELATANGYTAGGLALAGVGLSRTAGEVQVTAAAMNWTLTGAITFKYAAVYDDTAVSDDLLCFVDMETGGGSVTPGAGALSLTPVPSLLKWSQP